MKRRNFLTMAGAGVLAGRLGAIEAFDRKGEPRFTLGLAAYSFRNKMKWMKEKPNPGLSKDSGEGWDMFDFIDYCAEHGGVGAELTSYFFPPEVDESYLLKVKRHAYLRAVPIAGTAVGNEFTHPEGKRRREQIEYVKTWIRHAAVMGAPHIRVFAGNAPKGVSPEDAEKNFIECYEECLEFAGEKGIFLGLENHGGIVCGSRPAGAYHEGGEQPVGRDQS